MNIFSEEFENSLYYVQRMCKGCKYYAGKSCDYYFKTKKRRGCKVGECDKYEAGAKKKTAPQKPLKPVPRDEWDDYMFGKKRRKT